MKRLQREYGYRLLTISSFHHEIHGTEHITVGDAPDETDFAVVNRVRKGDIVVTQDWGLAAMVLGKGAHCLSPRGFVYSMERIDFLLDQRHVAAKHRRAGGRTPGRIPGPRAHSQEDDYRFEQALRDLLNRLRAISSKNNS